MALNYQTEDKQNFINRARFSDNGGCGYVLKPQFLRDYSISYSPNSPCGLDTNLYPGHFLAKILPLKNLHKVYDNTSLLFMAVKKTKIFLTWFDDRNLIKKNLTNNSFSNQSFFKEILK